MRSTAADNDDHEDPSDGRGRLSLVMGVLSILAVAAWVGSLWFNPNTNVDSGPVTETPESSPPRPQVPASGFDARCANPAPAYAFASGTLPDRFFVVLKRGTDSLEATKQLARKYQFAAGEYEGERGGFTARLSPSVVAKLRCDSAVDRLEEEPAKPNPDRPEP